MRYRRGREWGDSRAAQHRSPEDEFITINAQVVIDWLRERDCPRMAGMVQLLRDAPEDLRVECQRLREYVKQLEDRLHQYEPPTKAEPPPTYKSEWD